MPANKRCKCESAAKCKHEWRLDVMHQGRRWRMPLNDFALARGAERPVTSKQEAEKVWEPRFVAEIVAGKDPRVPPNRPRTSGTTVAEFLDSYETGWVEAENLRSIASVKSRLRVLKAELGDLPVEALNTTKHIQILKAKLLKRRSLATTNRTLAVLRHSINWGRFQTPAILTTSPFHKFGVTIKTRGEARRDRRVQPSEEQLLLSTALTKMNTPERDHVGPLMHDRIIGAIETLTRIGEMLPIRNRDVDWVEHQITIRPEKGGGNHRTTRKIPFDPEGRLAKILKRRKSLGPLAHVFGDADGGQVSSIRSAWETLLLLANGVEPRRGRAKGGGGGELTAACREALKRIDLHWQDLRHEGACRLYRDGLDIRTIQLMLGHSTLQQTQRYLNVTDEELREKMQVSWKKKRLQAVGA